MIKPIKAIKSIARCTENSEEHRDAMYAANAADLYVLNTIPLDQRLAGAVLYHEKNIYISYVEVARACIEHNKQLYAARLKEFQNKTILEVRESGCEILNTLIFDKSQIAEATNNSKPIF